MYVHHVKKNREHSINPNIITETIEYIHMQAK